MTNQQEDAFIARHDVEDVESWREDLKHVNTLIQIVRDREMSSADAASLFKHELRRALIASLFPDEERTLFASITRGSAAAGVAILAQRRWRSWDDEGLILLTELEHSPRTIRIGDAGVSYPDWVKGFALAATARDTDVLNILCTPASIEACSLPPDVIDAFWPFYCSALAAVMVEPSASATWIEDAESVIESAQIADPNLIELCVRPSLSLVRALAEADSVSFNKALRDALEAHKRYFTLPDQARDWQGLLAFEAIALTALAHDRNLEVKVESDYLPEILVRGEFPRDLSKLSYNYPRRSIASAEEAHWFLDLEGFPRTNRSHRLVEIDDELVAQYEAKGAQGMPESRAEFVLTEPEKLARKSGADELPPPALDAGELLYLAEAYASMTNESGVAEDLRKQRSWLANAVACAEMALARIPPEQDAIDAETISSQRGRAYYEAESGRFRRNRMTAYKDALQGSLKRIDAELDGALNHADESRQQTSAIEASDDETENWARLASIGAIEVICSEVMPILSALARDNTKTLANELAPREEDYERVFIDEAIEVARRAYHDIWSQGIRIQYPTSVQSEIRCYAAPAGMLAEDNELSYRFPGGYRAIARWLNPHRIWVTWKYLRPGEQAGISFDGLVWIDDHWSWFPKPFRVLKSLVDG